MKADIVSRADDPPEVLRGLNLARLEPAIIIGLDQATCEQTANKLAKQR